MRTPTDARHIARLARCGAALGLAAALVTSCGGDGSTPPPAPSALTSASPAAEPAALPPGWSTVRVEGLSLAIPPGISPPDDGTAIPEADATYRLTEGETVRSAVGVFADEGALGPLAIRTQLVTEVRTAQLGAAPVGPPRAIEVPGSTGAAVVEWRWDYRQSAAAPPVPSRQIEVVIQTAGPVQYGLLFGGFRELMTDDVMATFLSTLRVVAAPAVAPTTPA